MRGVLAEVTGDILPASEAPEFAELPVGGYYHASKYAVEALTDALRFEAAPFGIKVSLIESGLIRTGFGGAAADTLSGSAAPEGLYAGLNAAADEQMVASYRSPF